MSDETTSHEFLTVPEVAAKLRVDRHKVAKWIRDGDIDSRFVYDLAVEGSKRTRLTVRWVAVEEFLKTRTVKVQESMRTPRRRNLGHFDRIMARGH